MEYSYCCGCCTCRQKKWTTMIESKFATLCNCIQQSKEEAYAFTRTLAQEGTLQSGFSFDIFNSAHGQVKRCQSKTSRRFKCKGKDANGKECRYALLYHVENNGRCHFADHRSLKRKHTCCSSMPTPIQDLEEILDPGDFSESHPVDSSSMSLSPSQSSDDDFQHIVDNSHDDSIMLQIHAFLRQRSSPCQESQIPADISYPHYQHAMDTADDSADNSMDGSDYSPFLLLIETADYDA